MIINNTNNSSETLQLFSDVSPPIIVKKQTLFDIIKGSLSSENNILILLVEEHLTGITARPINLSADSKTALRKVFHKLRAKFDHSKRTYDRFLTTNKLWLEIDVELHENTLQGKAC